MTRHSFGIMTLVILFSATYSCRKLKKYSDPSLITPSSWNPEVAIPVAHATFGVYDILASVDSTDLVVIDNNTGEIALTYKGELASFSAEDFITIPNTSKQIGFSMADFNLTPIPSFSLSATHQQNELVTFSAPNGIEFNTVTFKSGELNLSFSSDLKHDITINVLFPHMLKNGIPVSAILNLVYSGTIPTVSTATIDLKDVVGNFTNGGSTVNVLLAQIITTITGTGQEIVGNETVTADIDFVDLKYKDATGYFGQQTFSLGQDSILINIFNTATNGYFELTNPKIKLEMINYFGFPVNVSLSNLKTVNANTGASFNLAGYPDPILIEAPTILGQSKITFLELNATNTTNISSIITPTPKYFHYEASATSNPNGVGVNLNFIQDTSQFKINAELELPMEGFAYGFELKDTIPFSFTDDIEEIESILFRIIVNNGFPVDLNTQITFVDQNYNDLLSLTNGFELVVASGEIAATGEVINQTEKITDLSVERVNLPLIKQAKHVIIKANAETYNGQNGQVIKLLDSYKISVNLGMKVTASVKF